MNIPTRLDLEVTTKCKYKCGICSVRAQDTVTNKEISLEELKCKVTEFWRIGGKEISISGGEPLERGLDFISVLIKFCKDLGLYVRMYTVGYGLNNLEKVASLRTAGLDSVYISLEGNKEIDEIYKGVKGSYEIAIKVIKLFKEAGINVIIHFTPIKINYKLLPHVVEVAKQLDIKKIRIMAYVQQGRGWDNRNIYSMNNEEKDSFNAILYKVLKTEHDIQLQFSGFFDLEVIGKPHCVLNKRRFVVTSNGFIIPSFALRMYDDTYFPDKPFNIGKIQELTMEQAWNSSLIGTAQKNTRCGLCYVCKQES